jgi:Ca2+-binding EF-hand superfamily protein
MGNGHVKRSRIKKPEMQDFHNMTLFNNDTIISLHNRYDYFSSSKDDDGIIDYDEFCLMINRRDNIFNRKIFQTFDTNRDKSINFREFIKFLSVYSTGSEDEQCDMAFRIFCNTETKMIEKEYMKQILKEGIKSDNILSQFVDEETVEEIVNRTFRNTSSINKTEFDEILKKMPYILDWLKFDISYINNLQKKTKRSCFYS